MTGRDLRTIREACGVTMGDLADAMGWCLSALSDVERDVSAAHDDDVRWYVAVLAGIVRARTRPTVITMRLSHDDRSER